MKKGAAIRHLFPNAVYGTDFIVRAKTDYSLVPPAVVETIASWNLSDPQPTEEQLVAAYDAYQASKAVSNQLRGVLLSAWESTFTPGEQAFLSPIYHKAVALFDAGDIAGSKAVIETAPSITEALDAKRETIVALFP